VTRHLPPLNQLRAFEAAARHLSFKDAAEELNVTHSAVSHQIRALEDFLGSQLFQRAPRGVQLTDRARELAADLTAALNRMDTAINRLKANGMTGTLRLSVVPWYANRLLLPNMAAFRAANPGVELDLDFSYELTNFESNDFHAGLRHGSGNWPGLSSYQLHHDQVAPVCAPELVAGKTLPLSPDAIAGMDLAVARGQEDGWFAWFASTGIETRELPFIHFENRVLATEFALSGNGVTLPNLPMVGKELRSGQLVRLHPQEITLESGVHLAFPETQYHDPRLQAVADWIRNAIAALDY
jgi:LysR family glycine cleavage system transcriptional activator